MKKYLVICIALYTCLLAACQTKKSEEPVNPERLETAQLEKAQAVEIGVTYKLGDDFNDLNAFYVKLIDDKHYVYMIDISHDSEKEIEERSEDGYAFYPYIYFTEGEYAKEGEYYQLKPVQTQKVEFKDPNHVKNKIIASKRLYEGSEGSRTLNIIQKDGIYEENSQERDFVLYKTNRKLPNSMDEFLDQYEYQPEELD
ncbi:hypothetical protein [Streptococcus pluranimalium]|uniref:Lipoprotein n=1 Tax=Streptococcus pluranimalium TaxID=82348 RepID=A0A2L0D3C5_9STRE|nr:hypothetical protein [Streptococcus pluranimalium]AUW96327.1 hypothetical protein C0J00_03940 [Streptococcus pluranimalium]